MEVTKRSDAIRRGLRRYFTGKLCIRGHISERSSYTRMCLDCTRENGSVRNKDGRHLIKQRWYYGRSRAAKDPSYKCISDVLTLPEFVLWYESQVKICAICGGTERLSVDHNHQSGFPRGILCQSCNTAEGLLDGDQTRIKKLLEYVS